jgi:hypothetical protein
MLAPSDRVIVRGIRLTMAVVAAALAVSACGLVEGGARPEEGDASVADARGIVRVDAASPEGRDTGSADARLVSDIDTGPEDARAITGCSVKPRPGHDDSSSCPKNSYCAVWLSDPDAASTLAFPDSGVLRSACESGPIVAACNGRAPVGVAYDPYNDSVAWVACAGGD